MVRCLVREQSLGLEDRCSGLEPHKPAQPVTFSFGHHFLISKTMISISQSIFHGILVSRDALSTKDLVRTPSAFDDHPLGDAYCSMLKALIKTAAKNPV